MKKEKRKQPGVEYNKRTRCETRLSLFTHNFIIQVSNQTNIICSDLTHHRLNIVLHLTTANKQFGFSSSPPHNDFRSHIGDSLDMHGLN